MTLCWLLTACLALAFFVLIVRNHTDPLRSRALSFVAIVCLLTLIPLETYAQDHGLTAPLLFGVVCLYLLGVVGILLAHNLFPVKKDNN